MKLLLLFWGCLKIIYLLNHVFNVSNEFRISSPLDHFVKIFLNPMTLFNQKNKFFHRRKLSLSKIVMTYLFFLRTDKRFFFFYCCSGLLSVVIVEKGIIGVKYFKIALLNFIKVFSSIVFDFFNILLKLGSF